MAAMGGPGGPGGPEGPGSPGGPCGLGIVGCFIFILMNSFSVHTAIKPLAVLCSLFNEHLFKRCSPI